MYQIKYIIMRYLKNRYMNEFELITQFKVSGNKGPFQGYSPKGGKGYKSDKPLNMFNQNSKTCSA